MPTPFGWPSCVDQKCSFVNALSQIHLSEPCQTSGEKVIKPQHHLFGYRRVIACTESLLLNYFSYCFVTIIKARNVFLMAH